MLVSPLDALIKNKWHVQRVSAFRGASKMPAIADVNKTGRQSAMAKLRLDDGGFWSESTLKVLPERCDPSHFC